jgi:hypothetical protein
VTRGGETVHPRGITTFGIFLLVGAVAASIAGMTLVWRDTALDHIWALNPRGYRELAPFGKTAGLLFLFLGATLAAAGIGWFKRCVWSWRLALAIMITHVVGDIVNIVLGHAVEGAIGVAAGGALLFYLLRGSVRAAFKRHGPGTSSPDHGG